MNPSMRRSFLVWAILALVWANLPYLVGYAIAEPGNRFGGFFLYEQDGYSYYAKMRQGVQGAWTFHLPYTSEDEYQTGGIALAFYTATGKLAALGLDYPFIYHFSRLIGSIWLLFVLARFIRRFVRNPRWQLWTWWLVLFSGGWGLLVSTLAPKYVSYEIIAPDAFVFSILYGPPHVIVGLALLLIWIGYTLDTFQAETARLPGRILVANFVGALAALSREAYGPVFAGVFAAYLVALTIYRRRIPWREGILVVLSAIGAGLYGVYMLIAYRTIPGFAAWLQQNPFGTPDLVSFGFGVAPLVVLAVLGLRSKRWRRRLSLRSIIVDEQALFIVAWAIVGPLMAYLPLQISRRLVAGWQIPLCILGAYALVRLIRSRIPYRRVLAALLVAATLPSTLLVIAGGSAIVARKQPPLFQPADQLAALDWLGGNTTANDVVLSAWRFGNQIPIYADARVFAGHPIETIGFKDKVAQAARVLDPNTPEAERQAVLARWRITLVVAGPGDEPRLNPEHYTPAFQQGDYAIYRVRLR
jgi:hypothetical protein